MVTLAVMSASLIQFLDMTIANVALPHMQSALDARRFAGHDHVGVDQLHCRQRRGDPHRRVGGSQVRDADAVPGGGKRVHRGIDVVRTRDEPWSNRCVPDIAGNTKLH